MHKRFRYRIYPTKKQRRILDNVLEECRWLYNHLLEMRKTAYEQDGKGLTMYQQTGMLTAIKRERPSLKEVHSHTLQGVSKRVDIAFQAFFRRCKNGEKPGYPRFKSEGHYNSFTYHRTSFRMQGDKHIWLSDVGTVKIAYHRPLKGEKTSCTVKRSSTGKWYVVIFVECEPERLPECPKQVGIDVGLKTFATLSTEEEIENPRFLRQEEKALAKVQRRHSKTAKGTPERRKHRKAVARVHERIRWRRENFTHQQSRSIIDRFGIICVEDLEVNRMVHNHRLAKSIADAAWSAFFVQLSSKAEEAGRQFIKVNPAYTSQTCSGCGHRQKMPLSERTFHCPCCFLSIDRDYNASKNILALGLQGLGLSLEAPGESRGE